MAAISREISGSTQDSDLREVVLETMRADPRHWSGHYHDPAAESLDLQFSLSDRVRYYWPYPRIQKACEALLERLRRSPIPLTLLSQYLPLQYEVVRAGRLRATVDELLHEGIALTLRPYMQACEA